MLQVVCAGVWHNAMLCALCWLCALLLPLLLQPLYSTGTGAAVRCAASLNRCSKVHIAHYRHGPCCYGHLCCSWLRCCWSCPLLWLTLLHLPCLALLMIWCLVSCLSVHCPALAWQSIIGTQHEGSLPSSIIQHGMLCRAVDPGGPLAGQLQAGDSMWLLNRCPVTSSRSWLSCLASINPRDAASHASASRQAQSMSSAQCVHCLLVVSSPITMTMLLSPPKPWKLLYCTVTLLNNITKHDKVSRQLQV